MKRNPTVGMLVDRCVPFLIPSWPTFPPVLPVGTGFVQEWPPLTHTTDLLLSASEFADPVAWEACGNSPSIYIWAIWKCKGISIPWAMLDPQGWELGDRWSLFDPEVFNPEACSTQILRRFQQDGGPVSTAVTMPGWTLIISFSALLSYFSISVV